jgi:Zn/Cd-binding protein ZinT
MLIIKQLAIFCLLFFGFGKTNFQTQNHLNLLTTYDSRLTTNLHAFHTSLTEINFNQKEKSLEISIRVFTDDFETALTKLNGGQKIIIAANDKNDALINKYIQQHFGIISPQKQRKNFNFIGKEIEGVATWIYAEVPDYQAITGNILQNNILTEFFDDQTNLVNFTYLSNKKTFILNAKKTTAEIVF